MSVSGRTRARGCPERTCVGCRVRATKGDLLRVVEVGGACVPDPRGTLPGRGAYLHPVKACLDLAVRRRAFVRALRAQGPLGTADVDRFVEQQAVEADMSTKNTSAARNPAQPGTSRVGSGSRLR